MGIFKLLILFIISGCATKYLIPTNRFMSPESQGGVFSGQFEYQMTQANQLTIIANGGNVEQGVEYSTISRSGFSFNSSFSDSVDFVWSHVGGANSMGGIKFQILGTSRSSKGDGHKLSALALFGGNDYETEDQSIDFRLDGQELSLIYGYRIGGVFLPYINISRSKYTFNGTISSSSQVLNGKEPSYESVVWGINPGIEFDWNSYFLKLECSYQQIETDQTEKYSPISFGFSGGVSW